jgi:hypothetical protein
MKGIIFIVLFSSVFVFSNDFVNESIQIGGRFGFGLYSISSYTFTPNYDNIHTYSEKSTVFGYEGGIAFKIPITQQLSFNPELNYNYRNFTWINGSNTGSYSDHEANLKKQ